MTLRRYLLFILFIKFIQHGIIYVASSPLNSNKDDNCDFDDHSSPFCHWQNFGTEMSFIRHSGSTMSHSTGPKGDHSKYQNGSYIYLEASNAKFGNKAKIISKLFKATVGRTLKFYVNMYGATVNYLKVFIRRKNLGSEELFKISGDQGPKWMEVNLRIVSLIPYQIIFEAAVGRTFQSDIAIDDVSFIDDKIPESGLSDWSSWTTCQVKRKWCLKDRFRLCLNEKSCGKEDKIQKEVASCALAHCKIDGHWSAWNSWSSCLSKCGNGKKERHRKCNEPKPMFGGKDCLGQGIETISCWAGFCQSNPDDCDFDNDSNPYCHWTNSNDTLKFHRKYLWTGTAGTGPLGDHSNNTHGKYIYLETSSPAKYGQFARITSKLFKPTKSRTLKFYTYMYGKSVNYLKVLIKTENVTREIWKLEGNQGKRWLLARIDFSCQVPYKVVFEAGVGKDFQSDIAIDTIHFEDHSVEEKFDKSSRKQQRSNNANFIFISNSLFQSFILINFFLFLLER